MINILTVNEFFVFGKPLPYDGLAKKTFSQLLDCLDSIEVRKFADDKREVTFTPKTKNESVSSRSNNLRKEDKIIDKKSDQVKIEVMRNYSRHRFSSKLLGKTKQDSYALAINGKHLIKDERGDEGKSLVSNNIIESYWNLLTDVNTIQDDLKRRLIDKEDYQSKLSDIKRKYSSWLSKLK